MPDPEIQARDVLNALGDPVLVVARDGLIEFINIAAVGVAGTTLRGENLCSLGGERNDHVLAFIRRCSGSAAPLVGSIFLPNKHASLSKYRCYGNALASSEGELVLLRCVSSADNRFSLLTQRIEALRNEIRRHQHTQAVLKESLRERELLVREIHHRVKNNVQVLQGMLLTSEHETANPEAKTVLADAARRLTAMAAVQQTLYTSDTPLSYKADQFLTSLLAQLKNTWPNDIQFQAIADPGRLPNDVSSPLALIISELVTNAVKYGTNGESKTITVALRINSSEIKLSVSDCGPGFTPGDGTKRSSGLGLVRGLARQLGGRFQVENDGGAHCTLVLPNSVIESRFRSAGHNDEAFNSAAPRSD